MPRKLKHAERRKRAIQRLCRTTYLLKSHGRTAIEPFRVAGAAQADMNLPKALLSAGLLLVLGCRKEPVRVSLDEALKSCSPAGETRFLGVAFTGDEKDCQRKLSSAVRSLEGSRANHAQVLSRWLQHRQGSSDTTSGPKEPVAVAKTEQDIHLLEAILEDPGIEKIRPANDLAAIYYIAAREFERPTYLLRAFETLAPYLKVANPPAEILWNSALVLESLALPEEARQVWSRYLQTDRASAWAIKARWRLGRLERLPPVAELRLYLPFVRSVISNQQSPARQRLNNYRQYLLSTGDPLLVEAANLYHKHLEKGDESLISRLADLHEKLENGYLEYKSDTETARELLTAARTGFAAHGNPLELWAIYCLALVEQADGNLPAARGLLQSLKARLKTGQYLDLENYLNWLLALVHLRMGYPLEALAPYQASLAGFLSLENAENAATVEVLLGEALLALGRDDEAWSHLLPENQAPFELRDAQGATIRSLTRADAAREAGYLESALAFQRQAFERARNLDGERLLLIAGTDLIRLELELGNSTHANETLAVTQSVVGAIRDPVRLEAARAHLAPVKAMLAGAKEELQLQQLEAALRFYKRQRINTLQTNSVFEARAEYYLQRGARDQGLVELEASLDLYEARLEAATPGSYEFSSAARRRAMAAYQRAIGILLDGGEKTKAYAMAVRARSYRLSSSDTPRDWIDERSLPLPTNSVLVHYCRLKDRTVTFVLADGKVEALAVKLSPEGLAGAIRRFRRKLIDKKKGSAVLEEARSLYRILLEPVDLVLGRKPDLLLVAEEELATLPFAALVDPVDGSFVIENRSLILVPSEGVYQKTLRAAQSWQLDGKKIALANPTFDKKMWPNLRELPGAEAEGLSAKRFFPDLSLYSGAAATPRVLRLEGRDARLLLIAAHSIASSRSAARSLLLLAKDEDESGALYQKDVYQLELKAGPLVILSACGAGRTTGEEAPPSSIANSFLAAGASTVIAPLFDINDQRATVLMTALYRELAGGRSPSAALRHSQLSYLADKRAMNWDPWLWSFFTAHGASR